MINKIALKRPIVSFVVLSYVIFWVLIAVIGISMLIDMPNIIIETLKVISSWSPTFALLILFNRIYPNLRIRGFIKKQFELKINVFALGTVLFAQFSITAVILFFFLSKNITENLTLTIPGVTVVLLIFLDNLVRGPIGEELGWRSYLLNELQKKYSSIKAACIVGMIWGFYHVPLWFLSGYKGIDLLKYCVFFMITIMSISIVISFFYNVNKNIIVPIMMHQSFNFYLSIIKSELLQTLFYMMLFYMIAALILMVINYKSVLYIKR